MARVLVVDDEAVMRAFLEKALRRQGYEVTVAADAEAALAAFAPRRFALVLSDLMMPGRSGLELLDELQRRDPETPVVIMTAFGSIETAVEAVRRGAADYLPKPLEIAHLELVLARTRERRDAAAEIERLRPLADEREGLGALIGRSLAMKRVYALIDKVAPRDLTVLVLGEPGTGKELCARAIHEASPRAGGRFQAVNCSALQEGLIESELFGHEKGAFTGADRLKQGHFEVAEGGTLFLDEVGDAPPSLQAKLLRALQEKEVVRVGGVDPVPVDVRVIAATNRDLEADVAAGRFREDLYYRLSAFPIEMAPLRERPEDVPLLVERVLTRESLADKSLEPEASLALERFGWPGNVRQLENVVVRAALLAGAEPIGLEHLPAELREGADGAPPVAVDGALLDRPLREARAGFERLYLERLLARCEGNVSEAARRAGMGRASLHDKLNRLGIDPARFR